MNSKEMPFHDRTCRSLLSQCPICNQSDEENKKIHLLCRSNSVAMEKHHYVTAYLATVGHICNSRILKSSIITDWEGKTLNLRVDICLLKVALMDFMWKYDHLSGKAMNYLISW